MKSLKPITVLWLGPLLLGAAFVVGVGIAERRMLTPRGILFFLGCGMAMGLAIAAPIAASQTFRWRFVVRHFQHFERWSSFLMAMGVGHWVFLQMGDRGFVVASALVFVCGLFRACLAQLHAQPGNKEVTLPPRFRDA